MSLITPASADLLAMLNNSETPNYALHDKLQEEGLELTEVYVVTGQTGEFSDWHTWHVAAFLFEEQAQELCDKLENWCRDNKCHCSTPRREITAARVAEEIPEKCPFDPNFLYYSDGVGYTVETIPLKGS